MRYKFSVLRGGSQTGKSTVAKNLGQLFGWRGPFIQTVQSAEAPDLKGYNPEEHGYIYILFDNVNHMDLILNERALFQANRPMTFTLVNSLQADVPRWILCGWRVAHGSQGPE